MTLTPFHLAIPVKDLESSRQFYGGLLGCPEGRSAVQWVDFNLFGHQLVCHVDPALANKLADKANNSDTTNPVDGHDVPIPHFGVVLEMEDWEVLAAKLKAVGTRFIIEPYIRFKGQAGEQATLFFLDPSGNALEFKAFRNIADELFKT